MNSQNSKTKKQSLKLLNQNQQFNTQGLSFENIRGPKKKKEEEKEKEKVYVFEDGKINYRPLMKNQVKQMEQDFLMQIKNFILNKIIQITGTQNKMLKLGQFISYTLRTRSFSTYVYKINNDFITSYQQLGNVDFKKVQQIQQMDKQLIEQYFSVENESIKCHKMFKKNLCKQDKQYNITLKSIYKRKYKKKPINFINDKQTQKITVISAIQKIHNLLKQQKYSIAIHLAQKIYYVASISQLVKISFELIVSIELKDLFYDLNERTPYQPQKCVYREAQFFSKKSLDQCLKQLYNSENNTIHRVKFNNQIYVDMDKKSIFQKIIKQFKGKQSSEFKVTNFLQNSFQSDVLDSKIFLDYQKFDHIVIDKSTENSSFWKKSSLKNNDLQNEKIIQKNQQQGASKNYFLFSGKISYNQNILKTDTYFKVINLQKNQTIRLNQKSFIQYIVGILQSYQQMKQFDNQMIKKVIISLDDNPRNKMTLKDILQIDFYDVQSIYLDFICEKEDKIPQKKKMPSDDLLKRRQRPKQDDSSKKKSLMNQNINQISKQDSSKKNLLNINQNINQISQDSGSQQEEKKPFMYTEEHQNELHQRILNKKKKKKYNNNRKNQPGISLHKFLTDTVRIVEKCDNDKSLDKSKSKKKNKSILKPHTPEEIARIDLNFKSNAEMLKKMNQKDNKR